MKDAILQYAIQGKLTQQLAEDGDARDLLKEIRKEKARLIKEGKIKKEKPLPEITEDEIPFEIPENWCWVRLGEIIVLKSGQDMTPSNYNSINKGIPYITGASNFSDGTIIIDRWTEVPRSIAEKGDLLITCKGTVGEMAFLTETKAHIARQVMAISGIFNLNIEYIHLFLRWYVSELKAMAKSMIPGISREMIINALIPIPPIKEQQRIVGKLEEFLSEIRNLENNDIKLK
jgi:type I restriction enzyme S subunit